jgi:hypothetical protein
MEKRRRAQSLCTIALVLGLHLSVVWLLLATSRRSPIRTEPESFELLLIPRAPVPLGDNSPSRALEKAAPRRRIEANPLARSHAAPDEENNSIHPPPDWPNELSRAAADIVSRESLQKPKDFGFPSSSAPIGKPPQFGWDYVATHRIESIPEGGVLLHLNDNCVLVLFPLPFAGCGIGKKKANGDLFEHLHDPPQAGDTRH